MIVYEKISKRMNKKHFYETAIYNLLNQTFNFVIGAIDLDLNQLVSNIYPKELFKKKLCLKVK